jgi:hypothetical protein
MQQRPDAHDTAQNGHIAASETGEPMRPVEVSAAGPADWGRARPGWVALAVAFLSLASVALAVLFLPVALITFSAVFGTISELSGTPAVRAPWITKAAFASGTLAACGLAYLLLDRASLVGYSHARRVLARKAEAFLPADPPADEDNRFFVLLEWGTRGRRFEDIGYLFVYADRLRFVGDKRFVTLPRAAIEGVTRSLDLSRLGLGGSPLTLSFENGFVRLQSRDADLVSQTGEGARRLETTLRAWLTGDAPLPVVKR